MTVDGVDCCGGGEAGVFDCHGGHFMAAELLEDGADGDFADLVGGDPRARDGGFEDLGEEFFGVGFCEAALDGTGEGGAEG